MRSSETNPTERRERGTPIASELSSPACMQAAEVHVTTRAPQQACSTASASTANVPAYRAVDVNVINLKSDSTHSILNYDDSLTF